MFKKENFEKIISNAEANIKFLGLLGLFGFPSYYFVWHDIFPQTYENLPLRLVNAAMFMPYIFYDRLSSNIRKYFPLYFCATLTACLPYSFCFMLLKNHFSAIWTMSIIAQTYLLIILVSDWKAFVVMTIIGVCGAFLTVQIMDGVIIFDQFRIEYLPIFGFTLASGIISIYRKDEDNRQKLKIMKSIAGSIAHEVRNPINSINLIRSQIEVLVSKLKFTIQDSDHNSTEKELIELTSKISSSIKRANDIINLTLNDLRGQSQTHEHFSCLSAYEIVESVLKEYAYNNENERKRVINKISPTDDFRFKGDETTLIYVLFNLIKNALYYLKSNPDLVITINSGSDEYYNFITVHDNGPGISQKIINNLFGNFVTDGKSGGTGLGLAFCKRSMLMIGGDITCESQVKKYTKFTLSFPKLSSEELEYFAINKVFPNSLSSIEKKILVVDDEEINHLTLKHPLKKNLRISCESAYNGSQALHLFKKNKYDLIIMDLEMPVMNGFAAISEIRKINNSIPIIAYSSLIDKFEEVKKAGADEYLIKPQKRELITKIIAKWINIKYNPFDNKTKEELVEIFKDKKIIIADDEETNLMVLSRYIESFGAKVTKTKNGQELLQKVSSDENFHLIITDINMPIMDGKEAVNKIRNLERNYKRKSIPIVAFTGNDEKESIHNLYKDGVNDYFVKGSYNELMVKTLGFWLSH